VAVSILWNANNGGDESKPVIPMGFIYTLIAGYAFSTSLLITKKYLVQLNTGIIALLRTTLGVLFFHLLSLAMGKIVSLLHTKLWLYALPYGFVFLVTGQLCWLTALRGVEPLKIAVGTNFLFLLSIAFAMLFLGMFPTENEWIGSAFILCGTASSVWEIVFAGHQSDLATYQSHRTPSPSKVAEWAKIPEDVEESPERLDSVSEEWRE
jgi:drug/metabolite transporter (DMT)-like permease